MMANLVDMIKQVGLDAMQASAPVNILYGVVTKANPLEVNVDQRFTLTEDFLVVTERLTALTLDLNHSHDYSGGQTQNALTSPVVVRKGLEVGDKVLLLRVQGGQQYVVLDRVVGP